MRAFDFASSAPWAILPETLETILAIAARENEAPEAVAAKLGRKLDNSRHVDFRDGVAVIPVQGPIFRYANLFTEISGGVSTEILALDLTTALENPKVKGIVLAIDSPGGEATGINELAKLIAAASEKKPVIAYGGGSVASGAYWLASAAGEIVADETAMLGSIGVVITTRKRSGDDNRVEIVSAQSPKKRVDPGQESGRAEIQRLVDDLAAVFVRSVAQNRGVTEDKVLEDFGKGGLLLAESAIAAGMADRVGTLEGVIAELQQGAADSSTGLRTAAKHQKGVTRMSEALNPAAANPASPATPAPVAPPPPPPVDAAAVAAEARKAERARIAAITGCEEAKGRETLAAHLANETDMTPEQAKAALAVAPKNASGSNPLAAAMAGVKNPDVGAAAGGDAALSDEEETLSFIRSHAAKQEGRA